MMNNWTLAEIQYLWLLLLIPILAGIIIFNVKWQKKKKEEFADHKFWSTIFQKRSFFNMLTPILYLLSFFFLIFAMVDLVNFSKKTKVKQTTQNVIFALDVSNSMDAEDIEPNRLTMAKYLILDAIEKMGSNRVGLIIFAGDAQSVMPLTTDIYSLGNYIQSIETSTMKVQGTDFFNPVEEARFKFKKIPEGARKLVVISDGEDNEGNEDKAIQMALKSGIEIITVGLGTSEGAPIPQYVYGQLFGYKNDQNGEVIISKRKEKALEKMAKETGGYYIDGNNRDYAANEIVSAVNKKSSGLTTWVNGKDGKHYFQYFLLTAFLLLLLVYLINPKRDLNL